MKRVSNGMTRCTATRTGRARLGVLAPAMLAVAVAAGCSGVPEPRPERAWLPAGQPYRINGVVYQPRYQPGYDRTGIASWYGHPFHGRKTASGETYDMHALTAAHTTLPLGSTVEVTNLGNGRSLVVRINDRGPFVGDRIIDMSRRGAVALGFRTQGTAEVRVRLLDGPTAPSAVPRHAAGPPANTQAYQAILNRALETGRPGQVFAWRDPGSGLSGEIAPLTRLIEQSATPCRNYRRTQGNRLYRGRACRGARGVWTIRRER